MMKKKLTIIALILLFLIGAMLYSEFYTYRFGSGSSRFVGVRGKSSVEQALMEITMARSIPQILDERQYGRYHVITYFTETHQLCVGVVLEGLTGDRYFASSYTESNGLPMDIILSETEQFMGISPEQNDATIAKHATQLAQKATLEYYTITADNMDAPLYVTTGILQGEDGILEY